MKVYADNAATTKISPAALAAMNACMQACWGNPSSLHWAGQRAAEVLSDARERVARCLNASPREITFTSGGSEADNQALRTAAAVGQRTGKRHIISTAFEHHAVLHTLEQLEREGCSVTLLPVGGEGRVTPEQVESAIRPDTCLVSVMFANNEVGTIQPVGEIGAVCRRRGVLFHTDAVQAAGHLPIDVEQQNIDLLSLSAHKFHGPRGAGALYARRGIHPVPVIFGGQQERGARGGTEDVPAIAGLATALEEMTACLAANREKTEELGRRLIERLSAIPHSALNGGADNRLPGNVNFSFEDAEGEPLLLLLDREGICASSGSACASGSLEPSHVLMAMGLSREQSRCSLRLTLNEENTAEEVDYIARQLSAAVERLRGLSPQWAEKTAGRENFLL